MKLKPFTSEQFETLFGSTADLARRLSQMGGTTVSDGTVGAWKSRGRIPAHRAIDVERVTGIPRHRIALHFVTCILTALKGSQEGTKG